LDEATYFEIVDRKTAELVSVACRLGARIGGQSGEVAAWQSGRVIPPRDPAPPAASARAPTAPTTTSGPRVQPTLPLCHSATLPLPPHDPEGRLATIGRHLGVAFQIQDDL